VNCWHFARLDRRSQALTQIGENAVALVNSYRKTAPERTALRQQFSQSMPSFNLICFVLLEDVKSADVSAIFQIQKSQVHRTALLQRSARGRPFKVLFIYLLSHLFYDIILRNEIATDSTGSDLESPALSEEIF
jgi:hypothetical protein